MWQPERVALRTALGQALFRFPDPVRRRLPRPVRDSIRRRVGPFAPWEAGYVQAPPAPAPGEVTGPPDFVGIGVQKAGTTWWFGLLAAHPNVAHRRDVHKERHFFARYATDAFGPEDVVTYHRWFPRPPGARAGEWTPDYVYQPWVPPLLAQAAPEARLLLLLRDPVERFVSGLAHSGVVPASHLGTVEAEALWRGMYATVLRPWAGAVAAGRMLVLQYERCVADPEGELARTYRFLGLDDGFRPTDLRRASSPTLGAKARLDDEARARLRELYAPEVHALAALVPDLDLSLWPGFSAT